MSIPFKAIPRQKPIPGYSGETLIPPHVLDRPIGELIREARRLSVEQVEDILAYQREHRVRFGEAAIALKLATGDDVLWALSQQFHYPYAPSEGVRFHDELVVASDPFSDHAERFRELRSQLLMGVLAPEQRRRALAVLSPDVGDGKSFFAANMAVSFSHLGARTLLIDADMRTPRIHELFRLSNDFGLSSVLAARVSDHTIHQVGELPSLHVLPAGPLPPNPLELIQRSAFTVLMQELLAKFDHIVVDTPAAAHGADARVLAAKCGAAMVIGRRGTTRMKSLQVLVDQVARGPAISAGVLINEY